MSRRVSMLWLLLMLECIMVPSWAATLPPSISIRSFGTSPTRIYQNERVNVMIEIENTGQTAASSVKVQITSSYFSFYESEKDLGDMSPGQKKSANFGAIVGSGAPDPSPIDIKVLSGSTEILKETRKPSVQPFTFSLSDPSRQRLVKDEVANISFTIELGSPTERFTRPSFSLYFDQNTFEKVEGPKEDPELPAGKPKIFFTIRSRSGAESKWYPINLTMFIKDQVGQESHRFSSSRAVYVSWCAYTYLLIDMGYEPTVLALVRFRDEIVRKTTVGRSWLVTFHHIYDPISPRLTDALQSNSYLEGSAEALARPSIHMLSLVPRIYSILSLEPELAVLVSGISVFSLIALLYIGIPLLLGFWVAKHCPGMIRIVRIRKSTAQEA